MMAPITGSIEIVLPPQAVFDYVADPRRRDEWQDAVEQIQVVTPDRAEVGMEVLETRRVPGGARTFRWQVTEYDAPELWGFRGIGNPINAVARITFTPLEGGTKTSVTFEIDFEAQGLRKIMAILARRATRNEVPRDLARLKQLLESN
jgi:uncharacterized protein YndB with AHSA1/START domain